MFFNDTSTIDYYNAHAAAYFADTVHADMSDNCDRFARYVKQGGRIVDIGAGSGRDMLYFKQKGFRVEGIDASAELCRLASDYVGVQVQCAQIQDWHPEGMYDGIWANASLLHLTAEEIEAFILRAETYLSEQGALYLSLKSGIATGADDKGRYFTNMKLEELQRMFSKTAGLKIAEHWVTKDRLNRSGFAWLNVIARKVELIYHNTVPGVFQQRNNRFTAQVLVDGKQETVHIKNTGRLEALLVPGAQVTLQRAQDPGRKTAYDLISVYRPGLAWVNVDSLAPNQLMLRFLKPLYDVVKPEYVYGESRFDFYMEKGGERYLKEVKGCTQAPDPQTGIGYFPDAPTTRGVKHLNELARAAGEGYHCSIDFVIQMNGIRTVLPNDRIHPAFGEALARAVEAGVEVIYHACAVEADRIRLEPVDF